MTAGVARRGGVFLSGLLRSFQFRDITIDSAQIGSGGPPSSAAARLFGDPAQRRLNVSWVSDDITDQS